VGAGSGSPQRTRGLLLRRQGRPRPLHPRIVEDTLGADGARLRAMTIAELQAGLEELHAVRTEHVTAALFVGAHHGRQTQCGTGPFDLVDVGGGQCRRLAPRGGGGLVTDLGQSVEIRLRGREQCQRRLGTGITAGP
jgi:hypothetical protein